jgi:hypothetical protein
VPKPSIRKHTLGDGIVLLRFDTQYALASSFLRIQEHYESSRFHKRVFSLEEYMDWYAATFGGFTYYEDWSGFNVPSTAFEPFAKGVFDPLMAKERRLLRLLERERRPFYVIGIADDADLTHEVAHALFFTRPAYRRAVIAAMRGVDTSTLRRRLADLGYHSTVLVDEVQAYLIAPGGVRGFLSRRFAPLRRQLRAIYRQHAAELTLPPKKRPSN